MTALASVAVLLLAPAAGTGASQLPVTVTLRSVDRATVEVMVENGTDKQLDVGVSSEFILGGSDQDAYWAPFDPMTGRSYDMAFGVPPHRPDDPGPQPPRLKLSARTVHRVLIQLREIKWARRISSVWPEGRLDDVVPPGRYPLVWELFVDGTQSGVRSTSVTVEVAGK